MLVDESLLTEPPWALCSTAEANALALARQIAKERDELHVQLQTSEAEADIYRCALRDIVEAIRFHNTWPGKAVAARRAASVALEQGEARRSVGHGF